MKQYSISLRRLLNVLMLGTTLLSLIGCQAAPPSADTTAGSENLEYIEVSEDTTNSETENSEATETAVEEEPEPAVEEEPEPVVKVREEIYTNGSALRNEYNASMFDSLIFDEDGWALSSYTDYGYNEYGDLVEETDVNLFRDEGEQDSLTTYDIQYDEHGNITMWQRISRGILDRQDNYTYTYEGDRITTEYLTRSDGLTRETTYNDKGEILTQITRDDRKTITITRENIVNEKNETVIKQTTKETFDAGSEGETKEIIYDINGNVVYERTTQQDGRYTETTYSRDSEGRRLQSIYYNSETDRTSTESYTYDPYGNMLSWINEYDYEVRDSAASMLYASYEWSYDYDSDGRILHSVETRKTVDENVETIEVRYEYNANGDKTYEWYEYRAGGGVFSAYEYYFEYDNNANLTKETKILESTRTITHYKTLSDYLAGN